METSAHLAGVFDARAFRAECAVVREMSEQLAYADDRTIAKQSCGFLSASRFFFDRG